MTKSKHFGSRISRLWSLVSSAPDLLEYQRDGAAYYERRRARAGADVFAVDFGVDATAILDPEALGLLFDASRTKKRFGFGAIGIADALVGGQPPTMFVNGVEHDAQKRFWLELVRSRAAVLGAVMDRTLARYLPRWRELGVFDWDRELEACLAEFVFLWLLEIPGRPKLLRSWLDEIFAVVELGGAFKDAEQAYAELLDYVDAAPRFAAIAEQAAVSNLSREWARNDLVFGLGFNAWAGLLGLCRSMIGELSLAPELAAALRADPDPEGPTVRRFVLETLRLHPPVDQLWAETLVPVVVESGGREHPLEAGALVMTSAYMIHRDPRSFAEPERFDPARFSDPSARSRLIWANGYDGGSPLATNKMCAGRDVVVEAACRFIAGLVVGARWTLAEPPEWSMLGEAGGPDNGLEVARFE